eukprot:88599-Prymnesium_polylepis.1
MRSGAASNGPWSASTHAVCTATCARPAAAPIYSYTRRTRTTYGYLPRSSKHAPLCVRAQLRRLRVRHLLAALATTSLGAAAS